MKDDFFILKKYFIELYALTIKQIKEYIAQQEFDSLTVHRCLTIYRN